MSWAFAASASAADLVVTLDGIESDQGHVTVSVFENAESFKAKSDPIATNTLPAAQGVMIFVFTDLPDKAIAVAAYHDRNDNGELDTNFMGAPKEGYGVSNNPKNRFGPPKYKVSDYLLGCMQTIVDWR